MMSLVIALIVSKSLAADRWLCTEEASQLQGSTIYACGVAIGTNEADARAKALENASDEFRAICALSGSCRGHEVNVEPKRTSCEHIEDGLVKCYRGLTFTPGAELPKNEATNPVPKQDVQNEAKAEQVKPQAHPVLRKGMTKAELLAQLGKPIRIYPGSLQRSTMYLFASTTPGCESMLNCAVYLDKGKVSSYDPNWSLDVTDTLSEN